MQNDFLDFRSMATCLNREDGSMLRTGTVSHVVKPSLVDSLHIMLGAGCDDWGVCLFLTIADAAKLSTELSRLLAMHSQKN